MALETASGDALMIPFPRKLREDKLNTKKNKQVMHDQTGIIFDVSATEYLE